MIGLYGILVLSVFMVPGIGHARPEYPLVLVLVVIAYIGGPEVGIRASRSQNRGRSSRSATGSTPWNLA